MSTTQGMSGAPPGAAEQVALNRARRAARAALLANEKAPTPEATVPRPEEKIQTLDDANTTAAVVKSAAPMLEIAIFASVKDLKTVDRQRLSWSELRELLPYHQHRTKEERPLICCSRLGETRNDRGSLRHDGNVELVYAIVGDKDHGPVTAQIAAASLRAAGVEALIVTSASNNRDKKGETCPRFHIIAPLSTPCRPDEHPALVAGLNGALGGILATESWTLSQSFYFGRVAGADFEAIHVEGRCIDELQYDIDPIGKTVKAKPTRALEPIVGRDWTTEQLDAEVNRIRFVDGIDHGRLQKLFEGDMSDYNSQSEADLAFCTFAAEFTHDPAVIDATMRASALYRDKWERDNYRNDTISRALTPFASAPPEPIEAFDVLAATDEAPAAAEAVLGPATFYANLPDHNYIHRPTRAKWPASSVDNHMPIKMGKLRLSQWLDQHRYVTQVTWNPLFDEITEGIVIDEGGVIQKDKQRVYNLYRGPLPSDGDPAAAGPWLEHLSRIYPDEALHITQWLAHRVQYPGIKCNHALVLGGSQGIGKDTLLEAVKRAIGPWNFNEVSPVQLLGRFNGFLKSVILRVSEARDLGEVDRFAFYDHSKAYIAAPPDVLRIDEKHTREYAIANVVGLIITTNHKTDGIYLPSDDRRHYVAWSRATKEGFDEGYWQRLWTWLNSGGDAHVAAYLRSLDLSSFDPKAPPPKTEAFDAIVQANCDQEDSELDVLIEAIGAPDVLSIDELVARLNVPEIGEDFSGLYWLTDRKARRTIPHKMERSGYAAIRNPDATDGLWKIGKKRQVLYGKAGVNFATRITAAREKARA